MQNTKMPPGEKNEDLEEKNEKEKRKTEEN